jgi:hypothetical protein
MEVEQLRNGTITKTVRRKAAFTLRAVWFNLIRDLKFWWRNR